jgi:hypothetical protein
MAIIPPTPIPAAPIEPNRDDRVTFSNRGADFVTWLISAVGQFDTLAANVYNNALEVSTSTISKEFVTLFNSISNVTSEFIGTARFLDTGLLLGFAPNQPKVPAISGALTADSKCPLLVPSYNGAGITATQVGYLVTVDFGGVAHNILSEVSYGISNANTDVFLKFATAAIHADVGNTMIYNNIIVTSPTTFTCLSRISATVTTSQAVTQLTGYTPIQSYGVTIPANTLQVGSSFRITTAILLPTGITARVLQLAGNTKGAVNQNAVFWAESSINTSATYKTYTTVITLLGAGTDSTFMLSGSTASGIFVASGQNIDSTVNNTFTHFVNFGNQLYNDYALIANTMIEVIV